MKRKFIMAILITGLVAAWWIISSLPFEDSNTTLAQSAYPPLDSSILMDPYPAPLLASPSPDPYPGPSETPKTPEATATQIPTVASFSIDIEIEGLNPGETANLKIFPGNELTTEAVNLQKLAMPEINAKNGGYTLTITNVPVGVYTVIIEAPQKYIRKPMGFEFGISKEGKLLSDSTATLQFTLIPPSEQWLPPCRYFDSMLMETPVDGEPVCFAEGIIDLYGPRRIPLDQREMMIGQYYYTGPRTSQDNYGVWGRNYVVDPSVVHDDSYDQFVAERVYADYGSSWIEAGWCEVSWKDERQYIYVSGSFVGGSSIYYEEYNISSGLAVETRVRYLAPIDKWIAEYFDTASNMWKVLYEASPGFVAADNGYNRGEIYTNNGKHPLMPPSIFDIGKLFVNGEWRDWNNAYPTNVSGTEEDDLYKCDMLIEYHLFKVHSPILYLPLILRE